MCMYFPSQVWDKKGKCGIFLCCKVQSYFVLRVDGENIPHLREKMAWRLESEGTARRAPTVKE